MVELTKNTDLFSNAKQCYERADYRKALMIFNEIIENDDLGNPTNKDHSTYLEEESLVKDNIDNKISKIDDSLNKNNKPTVVNNKHKVSMSYGGNDKFGNTIKKQKKQIKKN